MKIRVATYQLLKLMTIALLLAAMHPLAFIHPHEHEVCVSHDVGNASVESQHHHCHIPDEGIASAIIFQCFQLSVLPQFIHIFYPQSTYRCIVKPIFSCTDRGPPQYV
jgi:hypothetical protein